MNTNTITLELYQVEALVLFEWLASLPENSTAPFCDESEQMVLWKLEGQLETLLPEVVEANYKELVAAAKLSITSADESQGSGVFD